MSIKLLSRVWDLEVTGNTRAVIQVLCDYASDDGVCWPSNDSIAYKVGITKRQVQRIMIDLREQGVVETLESGGKGQRNTNRIMINLDAIPQKPPMETDDQDENPRVTFENPKGDKGDISRVTRVTFQDSKGDIAMSPEPSLLEPSLLEPSLVPLSVSFPRKKPTNILRPIPSDFLVPPETLALIQAEQGMSDEDIRMETLRFIDHYQANGKRYRDWTATWRNWMRSPYRVKTAYKSNGHAPEVRGKHADLFDDLSAKWEARKAEQQRVEPDSVIDVSFYAGRD